MTDERTILCVGLLITAVALQAAAPAAMAAPPEPDAATAPGRDWPQWRGPDRNGVSPERGLLEEWPAGEPRVLWRIPVGAGFSSVSVAGGRLYTLWDEGDGEFLVGLDAATGRELWRHRVGAAYSSHWGDGPRSTPAVDGGVVYAVSARGNLHAVAARGGRTLWSRDLAAEYGGTVPEYGYASSPMIEGDKLFVEAGGPDDRAFLAFDKATGELVWASQSDAAAYSSPLAITVGGVRQIVFFSASGLSALSPGDGRLLWRHPWESSCPQTGIPTNVAHPVFIPPDRLFVSNGYGTMSGSAVIRVVGDGGAFATEEVWRSESMRNLLSSSVLHEDHIYGFDVGLLKAIDAATGAERWRARGFERGSLLVADGRLIVLGEHGNLALVEAQPSAFRQKGSTQVLEGKSWTMPTLADGRLFLRNHAEMVALDLRRRPR